MTGVRSSSVRPVGCLASTVAPGYARPTWFNPGGGYASQVRNDGQAGWATSQWGLISYGKQDVTEDLRDAEGNLQKKAEPDCQNDCVLINASDGILDWQYTS